MTGAFADGTCAGQVPLAKYLGTYEQVTTWRQTAPACKYVTRPRSTFDHLPCNSNILEPFGETVPSIRPSLPAAQSHLTCFPSRGMSCRIIHDALQG